MSTALLVLLLAQAAQAAQAAQLAPQPGQCMALNYDRLLVRRADGAVLYGKFNQPLQVREGISDVVSVAMSGNYNIANPIMLRSDGTVWQWSWSGDTHFRLVQVKEVEDAVHITQGRDGHSVAILADGTAREWKRIGGPATRVAGISDAMAAAAGDKRVYYLLESGKVVVIGEIWRTNHRESQLYGLMATLGTGTLDDAVTPLPTNHAVRIPKLGSTPARKPAMVLRNLALFDDGSVAGFVSSHSDVFPLPKFADIIAIATTAGMCRHSRCCARMALCRSMAVATKNHE